MKLCLVIKYPPIQGGVSAFGYWMAYGLAERGHHVYVVTNADEVEQEYRIHLNASDDSWMEPVFETSGGFVKVIQSERFTAAKMEHIPKTNPFVTKLASQATQVVREYDCDLIYCYYYEPYGIAGYMASLWTGKPLALRHAGSDLERLMKNPTMATTYKEALKSADGVVTGRNLAPRFMGMGVDPDHIFTAGGGALRRDIFHKDVEPLDLDALITETGWNPLGDDAPDFDPSLPTVGIYGKIGVFKGSYDLVEALSLLKTEGVDVNFVALCNGRRTPHFKNFIKDTAIAERTWVLPFIPNWKIPGFIRACTAVCFLERDFPIKIHSPQVPTEILTCGGCLILSDEIAGKQKFREKLEDRGNVIRVEDPKDIPSLAAAIRYAVEDPERARRIGLQGAELPVNAGSPEAVIDFYEGLFERISGRSTKQISFKERLEQEHETPFRELMLHRLVPWLDPIFGQAGAELTAEFFDIARPKTDEPAIPLARRFCLFLQAKRLGSSDEAREFLAELLHFQICKLSVAYDDPLHTGSLFRVRDEIRSPREYDTRALSLRPRLNQTLSFESFNWQFEPLFRKAFRDIAEQLDGDRDTLEQMLDIAEKSANRVIFFKTPNFLGGVVQITDNTFELLQLCDGRRTTREVIDVLADESGHPAEDLKKPVIDALYLLHQQRALIFALP